MAVFTPKRREFVARYLADISKLVFAAGVVKQLFEKEFQLAGLLIGLGSSSVVFWIAYLFNPKD